jgi:hypothetical protein
MSEHTKQEATFSAYGEPPKINKKSLEAGDRVSLDAATIAERAKLFPSATPRIAGTLISLSAGGNYFIKWDNIKTREYWAKSVVVKI